MEMSVAASLASRMKSYENVTRSYLLPKVPVMVRIDGHNFSKFVQQSWVKGPFDRNIISAFQKATIAMCEEISNISFAFHQSDEVSFFLKDYKSQEDEQYLKGNVQKLSSLFASKFTIYFNLCLAEELKIQYDNKVESQYASFDARVWNLPKEEVVNNFIWRQRDFETNSINAYARSFFPHQELEGLSTVNKLIKLENVDKSWQDLPSMLRRGTAFRKVTIEKLVQNLPMEVLINQGGEIIPETVERRKWILDINLPRFEENKEYIEQFVF